MSRECSALQGLWSLVSQRRFYFQYDEENSVEKSRKNFIKCQLFRLVRPLNFRMNTNPEITISPAVEEKNTQDEKPSKLVFQQGFLHPEIKSQGNINSCSKL